MKTLSIEVRPAEPEDVPAITDVHHRAWLHAYTGIIPYKSLRSMVERRGVKWWGRAIHGSTSILVLDVGGTLAGYATLGLNRARALPQEGEIYEIYLLPEYQGIGLGKRLFSEARRLLCSLGCQGLVIWSLEENEGAISFYRSAGGIDIAEGSERFADKALRKIAFVWP